MKNKTRIKPIKKGKAYEQAVAEIFQELFPQALIEVGIWVVGPDGRRELDIRIDNGEIKGIVECKDFSPKKTGPVGISYIDELESKRRDLNLDFSLICSNSGFTKDAIKKAKRVGIHLIAASSNEDSRIKFSINDCLYSRVIDISRIDIDFIDIFPPAAIISKEAEHIFYKGKPVINWACKKILQIIVKNPIINCEMITVNMDFLKPVPFHTKDLLFSSSGINIRFPMKGAWYQHEVTISSSKGIYNWIRKTLAINKGESIEYENLNLNLGKKICYPPHIEEIHPRFFDCELGCGILQISLSTSADAPDLDEHVKPEDLDLSITEIPKEYITSSIDYPKKCPIQSINKNEPNKLYIKY